LVAVGAGASAAHGGAAFGDNAIATGTNAMAVGLGASAFANSAAFGAGATAGREVADTGIRVNCVAPGPIDTDMIRGVSSEGWHVQQESNLPG
jgi:NAD(P)-dependent dehydrogenase (short-subunit alcohol dehydrogenase family)